MKSAGKLRLELLLVLERPVPLRVGHAAGVEPAVDDLGRARHHAAAARRTSAGRRRRPACGGRPRRRAPSIAARLEAPRCSRRRPAARSSRRPRRSAACPSSGRARRPSRRCSRASRRACLAPISLGCQSILLVVLDHLVLELRRLHVPRVARVVDERRVAPPAEGVGVRRRSRSCTGGRASFRSSSDERVRVLDEHARPRASPPA